MGHLPIYPKKTWGFWYMDQKKNARSTAAQPVYS